MNIALKDNTINYDDTDKQKKQENTSSPRPDRILIIQGFINYLYTGHLNCSIKM